MRRVKQSSKKQVGAPPGTFIHVGKRLKDNVDITFVQYDEQASEISYPRNIEKALAGRDKDKVTWLNVIGLHDTELISKIGKEFSLHKLLIEDILNTNQRIKVDDYGNYLFIVAKLLFYNNEKNEIESDQISFVFKENTIISFLENDSPVFDNVIKRISSDKASIRKFGADYLLYALIDAVVDNYFVLLEKLGDDIDDIEDKLVIDPGKGVLQNIHNLKKEMLFLRNSTWPLREVMDILLHFCDSYFSQNTSVYFRDVYDHIIRVIDTIEIYRDMLSNMLDTYLSSISNKTNDVMKVLTIISVIFIPITCLAGIYGMNFKYIPELELPWGYGLFWAISICITILMITYFKRKKWL